MVKVVAALQPDTVSREMGQLAVWSVTSAKPGNGVELLRDGREDTYWQSDGAQPHLVNVQFQKKVYLSEVAIYADYKLDESYTPTKISVRVGNTFADLREIQTVELTEPQGWVVIPLTPEGQPEAFLKGFMLQVAVLANHQNGRDTHIRQVRVFGPRSDLACPIGQEATFASPQLAAFSCVR
ncbi:Anaphase-promoting complex subunit 10 [Micractinium conductrix]|uniref:Anaphase-promoting complex subunit 10 n=1 Tax=Micractinium conductrix TaxID=554055 RepID=A0A2P6VGN0_9CHLO|nr:Anaphase-promoting complex subunit 10 [Micractinium conductrix]|eukprot:PSC73240.1 Anaphase-promoting complex subunit 10 [Micractinium conductrix]